MRREAVQVDSIREAQGGKDSTRVPGHQSTWSGRAINRPFGMPTGSKVGSTFCSCGAESPVLDSNAKRQAWHRQHKLDVLTGGAS